jgi:cytochrome c biogenesis protein CcmG/thiol:disulfide interchange protein DsbE
MPALVSGVQAPDFSLPLLNSGAKFSLQEARRRGPVLAAFFKISCPVCQFAFPYLQRLFQAYGGKNVAIVGVSQDNAADTEAFAKEFGVKFPIALDELKKYPASNAYGLTNVPTLFWISPEGAIELSSVGWTKSEIEDINRRLATATGAPKAEIFKPGENVPEFKAG